MVDLERLCRFYAMSLPKLVLVARDEGLTDQRAEDLFEAHLSRNYGYFGAVDKTLSGFVVLDNSGDDAWLYDARDTGAIYFQDHEDRTFVPRLRSLEDYLVFRRELEEVDGDRDACDAVERRWLSDDIAPSRRVVSTAALAERLQWAVWFFGQPIGRLSEEAERHADEVAPDLIPGDAALAELFARERAHLPEDPQLAISWLLLAAALADGDRFAAAAEVAPRRELVEAFARGLAALERPQGPVLLPTFRRRQSRLLLRRAAQVPAGGRRAALLIKSLCLDARDRALEKTLLFGLDSELPPEVARDLARQLPEGFVRDLASVLWHFRHTAAETSAGAAATRVLEHLLEAPVALDAEGRRQFAVFQIVAAQVPDLVLRLRAARHFLQGDPLHLGVLVIAAEAAEVLGDRDAAALGARRHALEEIEPVCGACVEGKPADAVARALGLVRDLEPAQRGLFVQRVLSAPETFDGRAVEHCLVEAVRGPFEARAHALGRGLGALSFVAVERAVGHMRKASPSPDEALAADLDAALRSLPALPPDAFVEQLGRDKLVKAVFAWRVGG